MRQRRKDNIEILIRQLSDFVNNYNTDTQEFAALILQEHRTLQQSMFRLFLKTINEWSKLQENWYDPRNKYTVQTSKKIMEMLDGQDGVPYI